MSRPVKLDPPNPARNVWIIAGTPLAAPYPCRCHERRYGTCNPRYCPCAGRPDRTAGHLPAYCCSKGCAR